MSSSQPNNSDDQPHDSDSVEYSGGRGGVYRKRSGKLCLVVGLMSVVVVVIVFLIVGFISYRDATVAQARNADPAQLAPGNPEACVNPCRSPHFFCHPASERDEKGCFEPGCPCFPEHCHKRCPPDQECVLGSPVDYKGCFRPNCKCETIKAPSPASNCSSVCPAGEKCRSNAPKDAQGCHLPGCECVFFTEPDCPSPCPLGKRCRPGSPANSNGCFRPGCICEPNCVPRCLPGLECAPSSPKDLYGCFLSGCVCEIPRHDYRGRAETSRCISPCPIGKECTENSTRDDRGCFRRGCICEVKCPQRCPPGYHCRQNSPKDIEGCFLYGCICEPVPVAPESSNQTSSGSSETPVEGARGSLPTGDDKALAMGVDQDFNSSSDFRNNHLVVPHNKTETTVQKVSPQGQTDSSSSVSGHVPSPKERREVADGPTGFINFSLNLPLSTEGSATHLEGTSASVVTDALLRHSNASSSTLRHGPSQFAKVDNAWTTVSASQSKDETSHGTQSTVNGNESHGSVKGHNDSSKYANSSSQPDEQNDDDDDDDDSGDVSRHDKAQASMLGGRGSSENSTREKSDDVGTIQSEQSPPRQGQDSTSKTSEATLQATTPTTSSQRGDEGGISSTAMDDHASASSATSQDAAEDQLPPRTTASDSVRK